MITLDEILGEGALEAHNEAIKIYEDGVLVDTPTVYQTEWIVLDSEAAWPPAEPGSWVMLNNYWQNGVFQQGLYREGEAYYGNGVCMVDNGLSVTENLLYIYKSNFIQWCIDWGVTTWHVRMPKIAFDENGKQVGPDFISAFLATGFEIEDDSDQYSVILRASLLPDGKHYQWVKWMESDFSDDLKPDWI